MKTREAFFADRIKAWMTQHEADEALMKLS
jgi:hypothetical protein